MKKPSIRCFTYQFISVSRPHNVLSGVAVSLILLWQLGASQPALGQVKIDSPTVATMETAIPGEASTTGAQVATIPVGVASKRTKRDDGGYRIGAEDVLDVRVFNRPQLSREAVRVDERGTIQMPWISKEIQAACRTERELAEEITALYRRYLRNPQVDVFIKEYKSKPVSVIGAVNSPGRFQLQRRVQLLELLTLVNGPAERAGRSIQIVHAGNTGACANDAAEIAGTGNGDDLKEDDLDVAITSLPLSEVIRANPNANPYMRPGDIVTVLDAEQVFVIGNVIKPTPIFLKDSLTLSQAVAMAGGLAPESKSDKVRIVRQGSDGTKNIFFADLKAIDKGQAKDIALQSNDIIDVSSSNTGTRKIGKILLSSFFPALGQLPVRVIR